MTKGINKPKKDKPDEKKLLKLRGELIFLSAVIFKKFDKVKGEMVKMRRSGGQYINPDRQAKKNYMREHGFKTGKQFRREMKRVRRERKAELATT